MVELELDGLGGRGCFSGEIVSLSAVFECGSLEVGGGVDVSVPWSGGSAVTR